MNILRACYDWRVLTALGVLGAGIYLVAPGLLAAALPLLLLAACPLSMILMMKAMSGQQTGSEQPLAPTGEDRVGVLRQELIQLGQRQEQLTAELHALEVTRDSVDDLNSTSAPLSIR